jgi:GNAT superfamily N-acetyltransferase
MQPFTHRNAGHWGLKAIERGIVMEIDAAAPGDLDEIVRLNRQIQTQHAAAFPSEFKSPTDDLAVRKFFQELLVSDNAHEIFLTRDGAVVIGYLWLELRKKPESPFKFAKTVLFVHQVCVDRQHRRRGIARAMFASVEKWALARDIWTIELDSWVDNDAHAFFAAEGFEAFRVDFWKRLAK